MAIAFSQHAIARFAERLRELPVDQATRELSRLIATATVTRKPPAWVKTNQTPDAYLRLGDDICMPLRAEGDELIAVTVLDTDPHAEFKRQEINRYKSRQRAAKRKPRRYTHAHPHAGHGHRGGR